MDKDLLFTVSISSAGIAGDPQKLYRLVDASNDIHIYKLFNLRSRTSSYLSMVLLIKEYNKLLTQKGLCTDGLKYVKIKFDKSLGYHKVVSNKEPILDAFHKIYK